jgi:hypothetical protein
MLPERDLVLLQLYSEKRLLPLVRNELMLANVVKTVLLSQGMIAKETPLSHFLLRAKEEVPEPVESDSEIGGSVISGITGARVIRIGQKRKKEVDG